MHCDANFFHDVNNYEIVRGSFCIVFWVENKGVGIGHGRCAGDFCSVGSRLENTKNRILMRFISSQSMRVKSQRMS